MCKSPNVWILKFLHIWHAQLAKSLNLKDFKDLACTNNKVFGFQLFQGFGMFRKQNLWSFKTLRICHLQRPKSLDFNDFEIFQCLDAQIFDFH